MTAPAYHNVRAVVVGLGKTGLSLVRYLHAAGARVSVTDTRAEPPALADLRQLDAAIPVRAGALDAALLEGATLLAVSPGVPLDDPFFAVAAARGLTPVGDIELFARAARAPVVGITGTNGKSTVTTLVAAMIARAGHRVRAGGNLGEPALGLLDPAAQFYVLELSSFQLDLVRHLQLAVATVLNVTADHMDRYPGVAAYAASKNRIFEHCDVAVLNVDDPWVAGMGRSAARRVGFSLQEHTAADYHLMQRAGARWLARRGEPLLALTELKLSGLHNAANALAALAMGEALGLPQAAMLGELREFAGLPHRTQWVADRAGVRYINDSKGTNVGATLAAVAGLDGPLLVIAGGDGKGQDFSPLAAAFTGKVRETLLIGRDAPALEQALAGCCELHRCGSLEEAVQLAAAHARAGDTVLLSPACASLDMFRDYTHRGRSFVAAVERLAA
ncbi:MAG TPA: UDP-N-acetylmuramoyl-L-alanine--D-glutamate ligase [Steroidobacteraceae bacterium]|nr:UDP-N-acetylmuramoyl-L-alanine--D-glutamate ligase [Steroidobacteraceae bacterium]